jgi:hypothetical protein
LVLIRRPTSASLCSNWDADGNELSFVTQGRYRIEEPVPAEEIPELEELVPEEPVEPDEPPAPEEPPSDGEVPVY